MFSFFYFLKNVTFMKHVCIFKILKTKEIKIFLFLVFKNKTIYQKGPKLNYF